MQELQITYKNLNLANLILHNKHKSSLDLQQHKLLNHRHIKEMKGIKIQAQLFLKMRK